MPRWFTEKELCVLDDLTAHNEAVLASLGGRPTRMRGLTVDDGDEGGETKIGKVRGGEGTGTGTGVGGDQRTLSRQRSRSAARQRVGNFTRQTMHRVRSDENVQVEGLTSWST
jgi:hypothetical protein